MKQPLPMQATISVHHFPYHPVSLSFTLLPVFPMEEREQPSNNDHGQHKNYHDTSFPDNQTLVLAYNDAIHHQTLPDQPQDFGPAFGAGTYIVQVPKDQVFRVPSPQNAAHLERHNDYNHQPQKSGSCCCSRCMFICILLVVILLIGAIIGVIVNFFVIHHDPGFQIEHVMFKKPPPEFDIRLRVDNPNKHMSIFYDQDSDVTLYFKQKKIAGGNFPILDQDPGNSTILPVALHGSKLPEEIVKSINSTQSKIRIPLSLSIDLNLKLKVGVLNVKSKRIQVSCSLMVDKLNKDTRIWGQDCGTKG